jgi:biopolymer transport protein TolQ
VPGQTALNSSVLELVLNAGPIAKAVLLLLAVFSLASWALIVDKWWEFRRINRETDRFRHGYREGRKLSQVYAVSRRHEASPLSQLYAAACQEAASHLGGPEAVDHVFEEAEEGLPADRLESINRAMRRAASAEVARMERYLPFLATTASAAPFIGLFGTVVGVMSSFHGIGQSGSASLAVVAPGISEALIATAAGLGAAIPAVMGYNFFVNKVKAWAIEMESFSLDLINLFARPAAKPTRMVK